MHLTYFMSNELIDQDLVDYMDNAFLTLPHFTDVLAQDPNVKSVLRAFKKYKDIYILGIGGSSLGGQALYALKGKNACRLHFLDNIDPASFENLWETFSFEESGVLVVSKSGNTAETCMQLAFFKTRFEAALGDAWVHHFRILTENKQSALKEFADHFNIQTLTHHHGIGGRYCVFTNVGASIAYLCDVDFKAFQEGAASILKMDRPTLLQGAMQIAAHYKNEKINQSVIFAYADCLEIFTQWYAQLWGESLGKKTATKPVGITPICALGTVDQHSQLQLYVDGPKDKYITIIGSAQLISTERVPDLGLAHPAWQALYGKRMDQLFHAMQFGTTDALKDSGCPVRQIMLPCIDVFSLGQLMMFYVVETIATAYLLGVDPFDQPGVEQSKKNAMMYLGKFS
ncbi:MAG: Glucose-6-phosphate isomerase [Holosporales bacterium]